jgi:hypothetical protein
LKQVKRVNRLISSFKISKQKQMKIIADYYNFETKIAEFECEGFDFFTSFQELADWWVEYTGQTFYIRSTPEGLVLNVDELIKNEFHFNSGVRMKKQAIQDLTYSKKF